MSSTVGNVTGYRGQLWWESAMSRLGWSGVVGLALTLLAGLGLAFAWQGDRDFEQQRKLASRVLAPEVRATVARPHRADEVLPAADQVPAILARVERVVTEAGLRWRSADYRLVPPTDDRPASLEIRCNLRGDYPRIRGALTDLLGAVPALAIRRLEMSRPSVDVSEIEATLILAILLQDDVSERAVPARNGT